MLIYDDGSYEFEHGGFSLPKAFELNIPPVKIGISAIHMGSPRYREIVSRGNINKKQKKPPTKSNAGGFYIVGFRGTLSNFLIEDLNQIHKFRQQNNIEY